MFGKPNWYANVLCWILCLCHYMFLLELCAFWSGQLLHTFNTTHTFHTFNTTHRSPEWSFLRPCLAMQNTKNAMGWLPMWCCPLQCLLMYCNMFIVCRNDRAKRFQWREVMIDGYEISTYVTEVFGGRL